MPPVAWTRGHRRKDATFTLWYLTRNVVSPAFSTTALVWQRGQPPARKAHGRSGMGSRSKRTPACNRRDNRCVSGITHYITVTGNRADFRVVLRPGKLGRGCKEQEFVENLRPPCKGLAGASLRVTGQSATGIFCQAGCAGAVTFVGDSTASAAAGVCKA
jgi:hypothetical protein